MRLFLAAQWHIILPIVWDLRTLFTVLLVSSALLSCSESRTEPDLKPSALVGRDTAPLEEIAARVSGVPITLDDVRAVLKERSEPLTPRQALDIAIRTELLAAEARKRGFGRFDRVRSARRAAMARVLLERRIDEGLGPRDVPFDVVKQAYENQKERFVHGTERKVAHILVREKGAPEDARRLAEEIYRAAKGVSSLAQFEAVFENLPDESKRRTRLEKLPPFDKDSKKFVSKFVGAAFAIPAVGTVGGPVLTEFGYHVIYVIEELPAQNIAFDQARPQIEKELLPELKKRRARDLEQTLYNQGDVFIFEDVRSLLEKTP